MKTEVILLAAGQSKRFGGIKQLADIHGQPMVCHCLSQYHQGDKWVEGITNGHVVLGSNATLISQVIPNNVNIYVTSSWEQGMGHTLAESMQVISNDTTHVFVALADQVRITQSIVMRMLQESNRNPEHIIAAKYEGRVGAPSILPRQYFFQLSQLTGDKGAKVLLQQNPQKTICIPIPEAAFDVDTPEDLNPSSSVYVQ